MTHSYASHLQVEPESSNIHIDKRRRRILHCTWYNRLYLAKLVRKYYHRMLSRIVSESPVVISCENVKVNCHF